jgi:AcrR family transcriptional regulator
MSRPIDKKRPEELRNAIVRYLVKHGLSDLSLRPLAKALGCTPRVLLYHFGSKEKMIIEVLAHVRRGQRASYGRIEQGSFAESYLTVWKRMSAPESEPLFRLYFEIYGIALRHPRLYRSFLQHTIEDWLKLMTNEFDAELHHPRQARAIATVVLAGLRGFMLDFCTTHDRKRVDQAVELWLRSVDSMLTARKETF